MHGIEGFSKEFYNKAQSAIQEGNCDHGKAEGITSEACSECNKKYFDCDECCC